MLTLVEFGIVNGFAVIAAFFSDLFLVPALLTLGLADGSDRADRPVR